MNTSKSISTKALCISIEGWKGSGKTWDAVQMALNYKGKVLIADGSMREYFELFQHLKNKVKYIYPCNIKKWDKDNSSGIRIINLDGIGDGSLLQYIGSFQGLIIFNNIATIPDSVRNEIIPLLAIHRTFNRSIVLVESTNGWYLHKFRQYVEYSILHFNSVFNKSYGVDDDVVNVCNIILSEKRKEGNKYASIVMDRLTAKVYGDFTRAVFAHACITYLDKKINKSSKDAWESFSKLLSFYGNENKKLVSAVKHLVFKRKDYVK